MALKLISPPEKEPVTLEEVKQHIRVDYSEEDVLIKGLITAAREHCEVFLRRAIVPQTWEMTFDSFPERIRLPRPPLQRVDSIIYRDETGTENRLDPTDYIVDTDEEPGVVLPAPGKNWPSFIPYPTNAVRVRFMAGYPPDEVPGKIKQAIKILVGTWYENREAYVVGARVSQVPFAVEALLWPDRHW